MRTVKADSINVPGITVTKVTDDLDAIMQQVDEQIQRYGFEVVIYDAGSNDFGWAIEPRL